MAAPAKINLKIHQGATFRQVFRWESSTKGYVPIVSVSKSAPCVITTQPHAIPPGWRIKVTGVGGMKEINTAEGETHLVTASTTDTLTLNHVNSVQFGTYTSGGTVEYNVPVDLVNFSARMQIRPELESETVLAELTTENMMLEVDNVYKTIMIEMPPHVTELLDFDTGVYSLELVRGTEVVPFAVGSVTLNKEVTR